MKLTEEQAERLKKHFDEIIEEGCFCDDEHYTCAGCKSRELRTEFFGVKTEELKFFED